MQLLTTHVVAHFPGSRVSPQAARGGAGYQVLTAADGEIGVGMVCERGDELALVILELTMPVMGGEETFAQMHELAQDLPVILTSGSDVGEAMSK